MWKETNRRAGTNVNGAELGFSARNRLVSQLLIYFISDLQGLTFFLTFRPNALCPFGDQTMISREKYISLLYLDPLLKGQRLRLFSCTNEQEGYFRNLIIFTHIHRPFQVKWTRLFFF